MMSKSSLVRMATYPPLPLDPSIYHLHEDELDFFKRQTGIQDEDRLRNHILKVQAEAYAVHPYPCIRRLAFTAFKISRYQAYDAVLKLGRERQGALLLDIGCCFGNDARKVISDGFPRENVIASDLYAEFWDLGHKLFKTSPETYPVCFLPGDIFDPSFLSPDTYLGPPSSPLGPPPPLTGLTSLTPLQRHVSVIHTGAFFHLFSESKQSELAHLLATLLSPLSGSMILGSHLGLPDTEEYKPGGGFRTSRAVTKMFTHSPTSWNNIWVGSDGVFRPEDVITRAEVTEVERKAVVDAGANPVKDKFYVLEWSVTRV